jgi:hypothetical protein
MAYPTTLALITALWSGPARTRSIALWSALGGAIASLGPLVAGALLEQFDWGSVFLITLLVADLIRGAGVSNSPSKLLAAAAVVWLGNNLSFALLYWMIDGGGPHARSRHRTAVDFAFIQQVSPELAPLGWRPVFLDSCTSGSRTRPRSAPRT